MSELELKITVKGNNIGETVRRIYIDGESGGGIALASDAWVVDVIKLERTDGLPLAIEEDFSDWYAKERIAAISTHPDTRRIAHKAYCAGRMADGKTSS